MTGQDPAPTPAMGYAATDLDEVSDNPEMAPEEIAQARLFAEAFPQLSESIRRARGKQKAPTKQLISIRLDRDVLDAFRATGDGWQGRMNEALRKAARKLG